MIKRTKEQRQNEVKIILKKLNELHLNIRYDGIKQLLQSMKQYIDNSNDSNDEPITINISCPELNITIKGVLEINLRKKVWVKLECLERPEEE